MSKVRFLGLDVHADTIAAAITEPNGEVRKDFALEIPTTCKPM
jgi:hypothetical protein